MEKMYLIKFNLIDLTYPEKYLSQTKFEHIHHLHYINIININVVILSTGEQKNGFCFGNLFQ